MFLCPIAEEHETLPERFPQVIFLGVDSLLLHGHSAFSALRKLSGASPVLVLSSSWQGSESSRTILNEELIEFGLPRCTERTVLSGYAGKTPAARASEILRWVEAHPRECRGGWIALDEFDFANDGSAAAGVLSAGRCVHVDAAVGLTKAHVTKALLFLQALQQKALAAARVSEQRSRERHSQTDHHQPGWLVQLLRWKRRSSDGAAKRTAADDQTSSTRGMMSTEDTSQTSAKNIPGSGGMEWEQHESSDERNRSEPHKQQEDGAGFKTWLVLLMRWKIRSAVVRRDSRMSRASSSERRRTSKQDDGALDSECTEREIQAAAKFHRLRWLLIFIAWRNRSTAEHKTPNAAHCASRGSCINDKEGYGSLSGSPCHGRHTREFINCRIGRRGPPPESHLKETPILVPAPWVRPAAASPRSITDAHVSFLDA